MNRESGAIANEYNKLGTYAAQTAYLTLVVARDCQLYSSSTQCDHEQHR